MNLQLPTYRPSSDATDFAGSVAGVAGRGPAADSWTPGSHADDRDLDLDDKLERLGWNDLGTDASLVDFIAPAASRLGSRLASLATIDTLLGGAALVGDLVRHPREGLPLVRVKGTADGVTLERCAAANLTPVPYIDAFAVHRADDVRLTEVVPRDEADSRIAAWCAAMTGYNIGMVDAALQMTCDHVTTRQAFKTTLAAVDAVQQRMGELAMRASGIRLLLDSAARPTSLAYAIEVSLEVTAGCQQMMGGLGYSLEFPLQRYFRRASAIAVWSEPWLAELDR